MDDALVALHFFPVSTSAARLADEEGGRCLPRKVAVPLKYPGS